MTEDKVKPLIEYQIEAVEETIADYKNMLKENPENTITKACLERAQDRLKRLQTQLAEQVNRD